MSQVVPSQSLDDPREQLSRPDAHYEILDGQVQEKPSMGIFSTLVSLRLYALLASHVDTEQLGAVVHEALFVLDANRPLKRSPDVAFVSAERWPLTRSIPAEGDWEVVPDLAIEVISPNDVERDIEGKLLEYFEAGVKQVWHVRPLVQNVTVYRSLRDVRIFTADDHIDAGELLPGFRAPLGPIFRASWR
ncbi:MAG TPA: Uma2 family endonuclease [Isosphaeraceae bacterium]|nr:Uma2 family endonuclease [Isosphaeraceae bacterium]